MPPRFASAPPRPLYRIARGPRPAEFPALRYQGGGRFDDPRRQFRVLYATEQRRGAFVETLANFRPDLELLARARRVRSGERDEVAVAGEVPEDYFRKLMCRIRLGPDQRWLDLRSPVTHQWLRTTLAPTLVDLGLVGRFVWGDLLSSNLTVTQTVARLAFDSGFQGLVYTSSHDPTLDCWAIFEGAVFWAVGGGGRLSKSDKDLLAVVELYELILPR